MLNYCNSEVSKKTNSGVQLTEEEMKIQQNFSESVLAQKNSKFSESLNNVLKNLTQEWNTQLFMDVQAKLKAKDFTK